MSEQDDTESAPAQQNAVEVQDLRKEFNVASRVEVAVDGINLEIGEDEFVTLVGPSGCGKTTTLRCIAGLEFPTSGEIRFHGTNVTDVPGNKRNIAMMFQNIALYPHMKMVDNIAYPLKVRGVPKKDRYKEAERAAELMQIQDMLDKYPGELSGGQRQRGALARTIVQDPQLFLMDEPLSDLDAKLKVEVRKEIQRVQKEVSKPTLYVTHDQEEAMTMSDRIAVMNDGNIEQIGTPDQLYNSPNNVFVARFIGNPTINTINADVIETADDSIVAEIDGVDFEFHFEDLSDGVVASEVKIGVRPEKLTLNEDSDGIQMDVSLVERIGDRLLVTLDGSDGEVRATVPAGTKIHEQQSVTVDLPQESAHLFDGNSGETIANAKIE